MKKLFVFIIVIVLMFLFRDQLNPYWITLYSHIKQDEPMGWLAQRSDSLYRDLPEMNFETAVFSLEDFEAEITEGLANIDEMDVGEDQRKRYHRNLICELAVVYKKMAMSHMSKGNDDLYIKYTRKSRDTLAQCADLSES